MSCISSRLKVFEKGFFEKTQDKYLIQTQENRRKELG